MVTTPEQLAATLVRRRKEALERDRARATDVRRRLETEISREGGRFRRAFLIGSLARGSFGAASDVDVVVEGLDPGELGTLYGALVAALGVEVDLLRFEDLTPSFRARVEQEGVLLRGA